MRRGEAKVGGGQVVRKERIMMKVGARWRCWGGRSVVENSRKQSCDAIGRLANEVCIESSGATAPSFRPIIYSQVLWWRFVRFFSFFK